MDQLGITWLTELAKAGLGYILFCLSMVVVWWLDKRCQNCQEQSRKDAERMAGILEKCNEIMKDTARSQPELIAAQREVVQVLQAVIKQVDVSDDRARERAENIMRTIERGQRGAGG